MRNYISEKSNPGGFLHRGYHCFPRAPPAQGTMATCSRIQSADLSIALARSRPVTAHSPAKAMSPSTISINPFTLIPARPRVATTLTSSGLPGPGRFHA